MIKKEHQNTLIDLYKRFTSDPLYLSNCHIIANETKSELIQLGHHAEFWLGNVWVKDTNKNTTISFKMENGGHAWNYIILDSRPWLIDNSLFHQHELQRNFGQPMMAPNILSFFEIKKQDPPYFQMTWEEFQICYEPIERI